MKAAKQLALALTAALAAVALPSAAVTEAPATRCTHAAGATSDPFACPICGGTLDDFQAIMRVVFEAELRVAALTL